MNCNKELLGRYIEQIDRRNVSLQYGVDDVLGITNTKVLMSTKARPEYADLSKFYILEPGEFIYNPRTSRNGEKVGMAYNNTDHNILFTFNNIPFRIKPECRNLLDADYLYLFFLNPEFDRYARYNSWGSATELFPWEEMCRVELPVPSIDEQRKIVHDYQVITDRIELLQKINENLEEQMTLLFNECVVDNGEYEYDEFLDDRIDYVNGFAMQNYRPLENEVPMPVIKIRELTQGYCDNNSEYCSPNIDISRIIETNDLVFSWSGSLRLAFWSADRAGLNQHLFKVTSAIYPDWFVYLWTKHHLKGFQRIAENKGTTFGHIKREDLHAARIKSLTNDVISEMSLVFKPILSLLLTNSRELQNLYVLEKMCFASLGFNNEGA